MFGLWPIRESHGVQIERAAQTHTLKVVLNA
jgi:hypothetical protein